MIILLKIKKFARSCIAPLVVFGFLNLLNTGVVYSATEAPAPGIELYNQGKFEDALRAFENTPALNAADYFLRGNCHYRLGRWGQAFAFYEKALALSPNNDDIRFNRNLAAQALSTSGMLPENQSLWSGKLVPMVQKVPETILWLVLAAVLFFETAFLFKKWKSSSTLPTSPLKSTPVLGSLSASFVGAALLVMLLLARHTPLAVIAVESAQGRSGPGPAFTELFRLPAGTTVQVSGSPRDGWQQVRFSLGNIGWMLEKEFLRL